MTKPIFLKYLSIPYVINIRKLMSWYKNEKIILWTGKEMLLSTTMWKEKDFYNFEFGYKLTTIGIIKLWLFEKLT